MSWIKIDTILFEKDSVLLLCSETGLDAFEVAGRLVKLWCWADEHTEDGNLEGLGRKEIDFLLKHEGFTESLEKVGWLKGKDCKYHIPGFDDHHSQSAKSRALTAKRVANYRQRNAKSNGSVTTPLAREDKSKIREDKKKKPPLPPKGGTVFFGLELPANLKSVEETLAAFEAYRKSKGKWSQHSAKMLITKLKVHPPAIVKRALEDSIANGWSGVFPDRAAQDTNRPLTPLQKRVQAAKESNATQ